MKTILSLLSEKQTEREKDPEHMDLLMRTIKAVHSSATNPTAVTPEDLARQRSSMEIFSRLITPPVGVHTESFKIDDIPCELLKPDFSHRTDRIIMYCHGGGYTCGGLGYARILAAKLALHTGLEVLSFEYGLAPENPYPSQINTAVKIWDHLMHLGIGASQVIVAGDSAGGNLSLELCLHLKENDRMLPKALVLFSPWTDMRAVNPTYESMKDKDPMLTYEYVLSVRGAYAGTDADFEDPHLSPLLADLSDFPQMLVQVGSNEILRDDSEKLVKKLQKSGVNAKLDIIPGGWHVFQQMPIPKALHALEEVRDYINSIN